MNSDEEETAKIAAFVQHVLSSYAAGTPFFPRALLEDLDRQMKTGKDSVQINNLDGILQEYSLKVPDDATKDYTRACIEYKSVQALISPHPFFIENGYVSNQSPVSIALCGEVDPFSDEFKKMPIILSDMRRAFQTNSRSWLESDSCKWLTLQVESTFPNSLNKIVCFGLGTLGCSLGYIQERAHTQHAVVETIAKLLKKPSGTVTCYAQDPAYDDNDKEILRSTGIESIDDPGGFLKVDENTLVISICCQIPVKQIIADVQYPGAMLWHTVLPEAHDKLAWPQPADPDSSRVRTMIQHYHQETFPRSQEIFGCRTDLSIYVRRSF